MFASTFAISVAGTISAPGETHTNSTNSEYCLDLARDWARVENLVVGRRQLQSKRR